MDAGQPSRIEPTGLAVAIYHVVYQHERFSESAQKLFKLIQEAERRQPGRKRQLYLDIEGHRNDQGGFDADMLELQKDFLLGFLGRYLSEIHAPLFSATNPNDQVNDIPPALEIQQKPG
jgi:hypothetical protein